MDLKSIIAHLFGKQQPTSTPGMAFSENSPYLQRHRLEYDILPVLFFPTHLESGEQVFQLWKSFYEKQQQTFPYREEDFHVEKTVAGDGTEVFRIDFPEPETEGLCWRMYCLVSTSERMMISFVMEKTRKARKTQVVAIRADRKQFPLGVFPLYLPHDKDFPSMMSAETVMMLNFLQKTL